MNENIDTNEWYMIYEKSSERARVPREKERKRERMKNINVIMNVVLLYMSVHDLLTIKNTIPLEMKFVLDFLTQL